MKITKRQLRRIIGEMKSGQYEVNGQPFDNLAAAKKEAEASGFEVIDTSTEEVLYEPKKLPEGTKITNRQLRRIVREERTRLQEGYLDRVPAGSTRSQYRIFKPGDDGYIFEMLESQLEGYIAEKMRKEGTGLDDGDLDALEIAMTDALQRVRRRYS